MTVQRYVYFVEFDLFSVLMWAAKCNRLAQVLARRLATVHHTAEFYTLIAWIECMTNAVNRLVKLGYALNHKTKL